MTDQASLFDDAPGRMHREPHDTEVASAISQRPHSGALRAKVHAEFVAAGDTGRTDYENAVALGMFRHSAGTRREELIKRGAPIVDSGRRRPTDTGRPAIVWVLQPKETDGSS